MTSPIQVEFKALRKEYFDNKHNLNIKMGEHVVVQAESGVDLGKICLTPEKIPVQEIEGLELRAFVRVANPDEISRLVENRNEEEKAKSIVKQKIAEHGLRMKLVDAEYQFDRKRLVFFFYCRQTRRLSKPRTRPGQPVQNPNRTTSDRRS